MNAEGDGEREEKFPSIKFQFKGKRRNLFYIFEFLVGVLYLRCGKFFLKIILNLKWRGLPLFSEENSTFFRGTRNFLKRGL
jgi:hypothetical protein